MFWPETSLQALHKINNKRRRIKQWLNSDFQLSSKLWQSLEQLLCSVTQNEVERTQMVTGNSTNCWFIRESLYPTFVLSKKFSTRHATQRHIIVLKGAHCHPLFNGIFKPWVHTYFGWWGTHGQIRYAFFTVTSVNRCESLRAQFLSPFCSPIKATIHVHN
jgi:hypothetical protein